MWFARFFGGRKVEADEPARFAPPPSAQPLAPVRRVQGKLNDASTKPTGAAVTTPEVSRPKVKKDPGGFDPYNSGTFERGNAWERVIRR